MKGPTGCRYLDDPRQAAYVQRRLEPHRRHLLRDDDGYFWYQARSDDMIISAGYNIAAPEVEEALLKHPAVAECAVVGVPDEARGQIVKAFVVLARRDAGDAATVKGSRTSSRPRSRRTSTRARSSSSTSCRGRRPASCSGSGCARVDSGRPP